MEPLAFGPAPLSPPEQRTLRKARPHAEPRGFTNIRVIGVGGGGGNAVDRMIEAGVGGVGFVAVNTDPQALERSRAPTKIQMGNPVARRLADSQTHPVGLGALGAGGDPAVGQRAAEDCGELPEQAVGGADMVFIAAGLGGGTGTGAAPVIARIARRHRALTVGVVTLPFGFEGARRRQVADEGVARLREAVDALIVIPNDRLVDLAERSLTVVQAFHLADDVLRHGVQGIADLVTVTGLINVDFADVRRVMADAGCALLAIGEGTGPERAMHAARAVVASPLLDQSIAGASGIVLNVSGGSDLSLYEVSQVAEYVTQAAAANANVIFGAVVQPEPEAELRVTLIAAGMPAPLASLRAVAPPPATEIRNSAGRTIEPESARAGPPREPTPEASPSSRAPLRQPPSLPEDADPLDIPPLLRRRR